MNIPSSIIHVQGLLKPEELRVIDSILPDIPFEDGKTTATGAAREVKNNLQSPKLDNAPSMKVQQIVMTAVGTSPYIQAALMPKFILPPIISKYRDGMQYGWHTDSPLMADRNQVIRADLSITVFLSDPETYAGGELVIHTPTGFVPYKLQKGDAVIYPTTRLHCVNPVTEGERVAAVTWMQSIIADTEKRDLLFQLKTVQETLGQQNGNSGEHLVLQQAYCNLLRMWAEI
jgi:PKHD-type hydroxylase